MKINLLWICFFSCFFSPLSAATVSCTAHVTNRLYQVTLDKETLDFSAHSDNGFLYRGKVTYHYAPTVRYHTYSLPAGFYNSGLTLMQDGDKPSYALCLKQNECYTCK